MDATTPTAPPVVLPQFRIVWKHKWKGTKGKGTKVFYEEDAKFLADDLNKIYPDIEHTYERISI